MSGGGGGCSWQLVLAITSFGVAMAYIGALVGTHAVWWLGARECMGVMGQPYN